MKPSAGDGAQYWEEDELYESNQRQRSRDPAETSMNSGEIIERSIKIHGPDEFEAMRKAGRLAAEILDYISPYVVPGVSTDELDQLCDEMAVAAGAISAPLGYRGYPKSICTSINHVVCHGIPSEKRLQNGDIVNIDVTVILNGWHGDSSRMYYAGKPAAKARRLVDITPS